tara:strand:- start:441 stop:1064 length:624 start_codon:yes stop_codon:yes gene_type:complete
MEKEKKTLAQAMLDFRVNVDSVIMDSTNPFFNSGYASYNVVRETINPTLDMLGIVVIQAPMILDGIDVLNTRIYMADNPSDMIESNMRLLMPKADMQQLSGSITYARRVSLITLFGLATQDDDANQSSEHPSIPTWENTTHRNNTIVDARLHVDQDEMQEALDLLEKSKKHKNKAIESKRASSLWSGLGKEYQAKLTLFKREQSNGG